MKTRKKGLVVLPFKLVLVPYENKFNDYKSTLAFSSSNRYSSNKFDRHRVPYNFGLVPDYTKKMPKPSSRRRRLENVMKFKHFLTTSRLYSLNYFFMKVIKNCFEWIQELLFDINTWLTDWDMFERSASKFLISSLATSGVKAYLPWDSNEKESIQNLVTR